MRTLFTTLFALSIAIAQVPNPPGTEPDNNAPASDPPTRAARLSYLDGTVSFQPGGVDDWVPAEANRPMTTGDRLWTDAGGRAEMNLGSADFRLNSRTNFTFLNLDDKTAQVQLSIGTLNVRVRDLAPDEVVEIDTPQAAFTLLRPGDYRFEVNDAGGATITTVRGGEIQATANGQTYPIQARQQVRVTSAEGAAPVFDQRPAPPADAFDNFCQDRDRREDLSPSSRYVSRDMPGRADLDANGTWGTDPDYGAVWVPNNVPVGWSPYHYGHWAFIAPWGWTWIDDAPWGYAPFHYGRWAMVGGAWAWIPGPVAVRPVYAPALVAFVGGPGLGVGVSVGWFPLGPREVFVPAYGVSAVYAARINVNYNTTVYVNRTIPGAIVAVRGDAFVGGRPIGAVAVRVSPAAVSRVEVMHAAPFTPNRAAILGGRAPLTAHVPPAAVMNRPVVARMTPPHAANIRSSGVPSAPVSRPAPAARPQTPSAAARPAPSAEPGRPAETPRQTQRKNTKNTKKTTKEKQ